MLFRSVSSSVTIDDIWRNASSFLGTDWMNLLANAASDGRSAGLSTVISWTRGSNLLMVASVESLGLAWKAL